MSVANILLRGELWKAQNIAVAVQSVSEAASDPASQADTVEFSRALERAIDGLGDAIAALDRLIPASKPTSAADDRLAWEPARSDHG